MRPIDNRRGFTSLAARIAILIAISFVSACSDDDSSPPAPTPTATQAAAPTRTSTSAPSTATVAVPTSTGTSAATIPATATHTAAPSTPTHTAESSTPTHTPEAGTPTSTPTQTTPPNASQILFSPPVIELDNPQTEGGTTAQSVVTVQFDVYDAQGNLITPSEENPITVNVFGAPNGIILPTGTLVTSGNTVEFTYSGGYFPNPLVLTASMPNGTGQSIGVTQFLQANGQPTPCPHGTQSYTVPLLCDGDVDPDECATNNIDHGLRVKAAVGHGNPTKEAFVDYSLDTGSLGVIVPKSQLGPDAVGPGAPGIKFYDSSGNTYAGNYYLAAVSFELEGGGFVQSIPTTVLAIDSAFCHPGYPKCDKHPPAPDLHYIGIGFDRNSTGPGDDFDSPAQNVALQLTDDNNGADISPGYILNGNTLTLGINTTDGYTTSPLMTNTEVPGDWEGAQGCFAFPELEEPHQFCGRLLLDVGVAEMFLQLPEDQRPEGSQTDAVPPLVPKGVKMSILAGKPEAQAMSYMYTLEETPATGSPAPTYAQWGDKMETFVNTGRRALFAYDYLYDARCGQVGFQPTN